MSITFPFKEEESSIFKKIKRPLAEVYFQTNKSKKWQSVEMIVDSGADYTLLPKFLSNELEIDLNKDTEKVSTSGIGGSTTVFLLKKRLRVKIGNYERNIVIGFADNNFIPALLGRYTFLETFRVVFEKFTTTFSE